MVGDPTSITGAVALIPGQGTKIPRAMRYSQKKKKTELNWGKKSELKFKIVNLPVKIMQLLGTEPELTPRLKDRTNHCATRLSRMIDCGVERQRAAGKTGTEETPEGRASAAPRDLTCLLNQLTLAFPSIK